MSGRFGAPSLLAFLLLAGCLTAGSKARQLPPEPAQACSISETNRVKYFALRASADEREWTEALTFLLTPSAERKQLLLKKLRNVQEAPGIRLVALEHLSAAAISAGKLEEAVELWQTRPAIPGLEQWSDCVISLLRTPREDVKLIPLEGDVNSVLAEYDAEPDLSGKRMFFTRLDPRSETGKPGEDIWFAELSSGKWHSRPVRELNTETHESVLASSLDGSSIFVFGNYSGPASGDIFLSHLTKSGWSKPVPLPAPINSEYFESDARPTPDGKAILFASDRPDGPYPYHPRSRSFAGTTQGNTDLYISFASPDGSYSKPVNLGMQINTPGAERNPFLHADGKTLYFVSNGHPGLGEMDIFRSVRLDDTWTKWSTPENLGPQINTPASDSGFRLTGRGDEGLIGSVSYSGGTSSDIFRVVPLPRRLRPAEEVSLLRGDVKDAAGSPVQADVIWRKEGSTVEEGRSRSRPDTGEYVVPLRRDRKYEIELRKDGYFRQTFPVDTAKPEAREKDSQVPVVLRADPAYKPPLDRQLPPPQKVERAGTVPAAAIVYFQQSGLRIKNPRVLEPLIAFLKQNPAATVSITAHTDSTGSAQMNRDLSERRARAIFNHLTGRGIAPARISYRGAGEGRPAATNRSGRGRQLNRRAVVKVSIPEQRGQK